MTHYTLRASDFRSPEDAIAIISRMGWVMEQDDNIISVSVPSNEENLFLFIFDYFV